MQTSVPVCCVCMYTFTLCGQKPVGLACLIKQQMAAAATFNITQRMSGVDGNVCLRIFSVPMYMRLTNMAATSHL